MRIKRTISGALLLLALTGLCRAQEIDVETYLSADGLRADDTIKAAVVMSIPAELHTNSHTPTLDFLIATELKVAPAEGLSFSQVTYPTGIMKAMAFSDEKVSLYEKEVVFFFDITADAEAAPGEVPVSAVLTYQACNDTQCFIPKDAEVSIPVRIAAPGDEVTRTNSEMFKDADPEPESKEDDPLEDKGYFLFFLSIFLAGIASILMSAT